MNLLRFSVVLVLLLGLANGQINFSTSWGKRSPSPSSTGQQQQQLSPSLLQFISSTRPDLLLQPQQQKESAGHVAACRSLHLIRQSIDVSLFLSIDPTARCLLFFLLLRIFSFSNFPIRRLFSSRWCVHTTNDSRPLNPTSFPWKKNPLPFF